MPLTSRPPATSRPRRRARAAVAALAVIFVLVASIVATAPGPVDAARNKPTAAVAVGDSFISGEGAGDYLPVRDRNGNNVTFPGWSAANDSAFFCHRSANASIEVAALSAIDARFNISCSGGVTQDLANPSYARDRGRQVEPQLDQLRRIADTHDIDLVLLGLGANDVGFSSAAKACVDGFLTDAFTGWWEAWVNIWRPHATTRGACSRGDFPTTADLANTTNDLERSLRQLLATLDEIDADGDHRIVIQNYVNPMPDRFDSSYHSEDGRTDLRDKFRALARERYAAGCPVHTSAQPLAASMTSSLADMAAEAQHRVMLDHPDADIVYLDVMDAFNGARLCERTGSPGNALHTPVRVRDGQGRSIDSISGKNKSDLKKMFEGCENHFQRCQESLHPNAAGHALLGQCLAGAWTANRPVVWCNGSGGRVSPIERPARIDPNISMRISEGLDRNGAAVIILDGTWFVETVDAPGRTISSVSVRFNTGTATLATRTGRSGAVTANVRCTGTSTNVYASVTATLDDGSRLNGSSSVRAVCPGQPGGGGQPKR